MLAARRRRVCSSVALQDRTCGAGATPKPHRVQQNPTVKCWVWGGRALLQLPAHQQVSLLALFRIKCQKCKKIPGGFCALRPFPQLASTASSRQTDRGTDGAGSLPVGLCTLQKSNSSTTVSEKKKVICKRGRKQGLGGDGAACTTANAAPWLLQGCAPSTPQPSQAPSCSQPFPESKREVCAARLLFLLCSFAALSCSLQRLQVAGGPAPPAPGTAPGEVPGCRAGTRCSFCPVPEMEKRNSKSQARRAGSARTSAFLQGSFFLPALVWAGERNPELTLVVGSPKLQQPARCRGWRSRRRQTGAAGAVWSLKRNWLVAAAQPGNPPLSCTSHGIFLFFQPKPQGCCGSGCRGLPRTHPGPRLLCGEGWRQAAKPPGAGVPSPDEPLTRCPPDRELHHVGTGGESLARGSSPAKPPGAEGTAANFAFATKTCAGFSSCPWQSSQGPSSWDPPGPGLSPPCSPCPRREVPMPLSASNYTLWPLVTKAH